MSKLEEGIQRDGIQKKLLSLLEIHSNTRRFVDELSKTGELLFFGGVIRDLLIENEEYPRDFDIAIKFNNKNEFEKLINKYEYRKNRFGGYKVNVSGKDFDIWDMNNTWAFKNTGLKPSEENLAKSVYLNIDGIVYNYNSDTLHADLLNESIKKKELDISLEENPQVELNLLRALVFKKKYSLNMSNKLKNIFKDNLNSMNIENLTSKLLNLQNSHYKIEKISEQEIKKELEII